MVSNDNIEKAIRFKNLIEEKFKNIYIILKPQDLEDENWNLKQIKYIAERQILELRNYHVDIFFNTGSDIMKLAWFLVHYSLGLHTRLVQLVIEKLSKKRKPELYVLDFETSHTPLLAIIRQEEIINTIEDDFIFTPSIKKVYQKALKFSQISDIPLFISGETGVGKKTLAKYIHKASVREKKPFNIFNCAAYPEQEIIYRLFGYKKGAFPGAVYNSKGLLVETHGGTLYLENFHTLSLPLQNLIYTFLSDKSVYPIVGRAKKVDVRLLLGISKSLKELLKEKKLLVDLYYRIGISLHLPSFASLPIDEKKIIINKINQRKRKQYRKQEPLELCRDLWNFFYSYSFPANFNELFTIFDNLYICAQSKEVCIDLLPDYLSIVQEPQSLSLAEVEKLHIERVLKLFKGNKSRSARALGIALNTLKKKIKDYNINIEKLLK